jgi:hypothetical protein
MHQSVVKRWACPPWKPDKGFIRQVTQSEFLQLGERMPLGDCQLDIVYCDAKLVQFPVGFWHEVEESCIQAAGLYGVQLLQTWRGLNLQFHARSLLPKSTEGVGNDAVPGRILGETDAQRP